MDDPRSPNKGYEERGVRPLSAPSGGATVGAWQAQLVASARFVQACGLTHFPGGSGRLFRVMQVLAQLGLYRRSRPIAASGIRRK